MKLKNLTREVFSLGLESWSTRYGLFGLSARERLMVVVAAAGDVYGDDGGGDDDDADATAADGCGAVVAAADDDDDVDAGAGAVAVAVAAVAVAAAAAAVTPLESRDSSQTEEILRVEQFSVSINYLPFVPDVANSSA